MLIDFPSMKVPPKRKGNLVDFGEGGGCGLPSMKVPPKRKGNRAQSSHASESLAPQ